MSGCPRICLPTRDNAQHGSGVRSNMRSHSRPKASLPKPNHPGAFMPASERESHVKKFVLLHYGFEKPTPEIMAAWGKWFEATKPHMVEMGGFGRGRDTPVRGT